MSRERRKHQHVPYKFEEVLTAIADKKKPAQKPINKPKTKRKPASKP
jgi:hypothetical protein